MTLAIQGPLCRWGLWRIPLLGPPPRWLGWGWCLWGASGSLSGRTSTRRRWPGSSRRSSSDDSNPEWGARVASDRPHRYAQRIRRSGADRPRNIEARSAFGPSVRFSRPPRVSDQVSLERRPGLMPVLKAIGARAIPVAIVG